MENLGNSMALTTDGFPTVNVPVLSKTTAFTCMDNIQIHWDLYSKCQVDEKKIWKWIFSQAPIITDGEKMGLVILLEKRSIAHYYCLFDQNSVQWNIESNIQPKIINYKTKNKIFLQFEEIEILLNQGLIL